MPNAHSGATNSLWAERDRAFSFPSLETSLDVDVAIVGGGIVGSTVAYVLAETGMSVALVEGHEIGTGTTGNSTAKCTAFPVGSLSQMTSAAGAEATLLLGQQS